MMTVYKMIESPKEGELVQYLGSYVTKWPHEYGPPQVAFVELDGRLPEDAQINDQLAHLHEMKMEIAPILDEINRLEKQVKSELLETGDLPDVPGVKIKYRNGYTCSSWDNKALRDYAVNNPEIMQFCKETQIGATVALSYSAI